MPEAKISPATKLFVMGRRTAMVQGSRIAIAASKAITKPITTALAKRKATKVAAKKAAEAKVRAQQRARAEREERRKMLEQNKKKAGTSDLDRVNKDLKNADNDRNKEILKKVAQKSAIVGSAVNNERRKMKANAK